LSIRELNNGCKSPHGVGSGREYQEATRIIACGSSPHEGESRPRYPVRADASQRVVPWRSAIPASRASDPQVHAIKRISHKIRLTVFVDGCFWHDCPAHETEAHANSDYWTTKIRQNRDRDTDIRPQTISCTVLRIWEHQSAGEVVARRKKPICILRTRFLCERNV
jgi:hypothetical protein